VCPFFPRMRAGYGRRTVAKALRSCLFLPATVFGSSQCVLDLLLATWSSRPAALTDPRPVFQRWSVRGQTFTLQLGGLSEASGLPPELAVRAGGNSFRPLLSLQIYPFYKRVSHGAAEHRGAGSSYLPTPPCLTT